MLRTKPPQHPANEYPNYENPIQLTKVACDIIAYEYSRMQPDYHLVNYSRALSVPAYFAIPRHCESTPKIQRSTTA
jgi:hypothetical protein